MEPDYKVKLEVFEGPLDLLLYLIKQDEIDIYDISIERITRQYLEYLQAFKELNIELAGEFIVMAANLIYLKSRSLLPVDQQPPEEDTDEDDPRWDLIRQLIEYKKFKEAAAELHQRELEQERIFARGGDPTPPLQESLRLGEVGIFQLINAFQAVIKKIEARQDVQEIFGERFQRFGEDRHDFAPRGNRCSYPFFRFVRGCRLAPRGGRDFSCALGTDSAQTSPCRSEKHL
jgi:segregation and condensation protein A